MNAAVVGLDAGRINRCLSSTPSPSLTTTTNGPTVYDAWS